MHFNEEEISFLKKWIVKRIENVSDASADADPDVLAEFVLTLLGHDRPEDELRLLCATELQTFLEIDTANTLVTDIFDALTDRSYLPEALSFSKRSVEQAFDPPKGPSRPSLRGQGNNRATYTRSTPSRKRTYQDLDAPEARDGQSSRPQDRAFKQPRRGGSRGDVVSPRGNRGGRPSFSGQYNDNSSYRAGGNPNAPGAQSSSAPPLLPAGFPIDPTQDPIGAFIAMGQAMGLPPLPGMPSFNQLGRGQGAASLSAFSNPQEYDPKTALLPNFQRDLSSHTNGNSNHSQSQGSGRDGRSGLTFGRSIQDRSKTSIVVANIPEESFAEPIVRGFFGQFGTIEQVEMRAYRRLVFIQFDSHEAANRAYSSPKVIFNNRFVKVYWPKPEDQAGFAGAVNINGSATAYQNGGDNTEENTPSMEEIIQKQAQLQKQHEEKTKLRAAAEKQQRELNEQREQLAKAQAEESEKLMSKLTARSRAKKQSQTHSSQTENGPVGNDEEELDEEGKQLKRMLDALKKKAKGMGIDVNNLPTGSKLNGPLNSPYRGRGRGRGAYRGRGSYYPRGRGGYDSSFGRGGYRGRGGYVRPLKLDNRTRKIAVSTEKEFDPSNDEDLRQHLLSIGEYESIEPDSDHKETVVITFKDRYTADKFYYADKNVPGLGKISLKWINPLLPVSSTPKQNDAMDMVEENSSKTEAENGFAGGAEKQEDYDIAEDDNWGVT